LKIKKRSGKFANLDLSNIRKQTEPACNGLNADYETLEFNANLSFTDGMESKEIQTVLIQSALNLIDVDKPDYVYVAARLAIYDLYHDMKRIYKKNKSNENIYHCITLQDYAEMAKDKLSYDKYVEIIQLLEKDSYTRKQISKMTKIGTPTIGRIARREKRFEDYFVRYKN
jgi:hypothetical protein